MEKRESSYWKQRYDQIEQAANNQSAEYLHELEEKYRAAVYEIDKKINAWYQRLAFNNDLVTISDAKKLLNKAELEEFKWNVKQYIKAGRENGINKKWEKELENASARFHINRLEALKLEIRQQVELATGGLVDGVDDLLKRVYTDTFYKSCFEVQKGFGVGFDVSQLDDNLVSRLISKPWSVDGVNFSEKLWKNKALLINNLDQELSRMVLTGASPRKAVKRIKKAMDSSLYAAKRLIYTEQAYFTSVAQKDAYGELDVEEYEFVGTLDNLMCEECAKLDGKHYPIEEMVVGVNAPPMHPFCRCTTCPYFNDEFMIGKRASRDEEGNTVYEVPANMTYQDWKEKFVANSSKNDIVKEIEIPIRLLSAKGMNIEILDAIENGINRTLDEYHIKLNEIQIKDCSFDYPNTPYMCIYDEVNGKHITNFIINSGFDFTGFEDVVKAGYETGYFAGKTIEDHIFHEMVHVMTGQDIEGSDDFNIFFLAFEREFIEGVSGYSDFKRDGFETIAEAAVRIRNNEDVPDKAKELVEKYISRWKK